MDDAPRKVQFTALDKDVETWKGSKVFRQEDLTLLAKVTDRANRLFRWLVRLLRPPLHHLPLACRKQAAPPWQDMTCTSACGLP